MKFIAFVATVEYSRDPIIGTYLLANQLRRKLCEQERAVENSLAIVVVVGGKSKIIFMLC